MGLRAVLQHLHGTATGAGDPEDRHPGTAGCQVLSAARSLRAGARQDRTSLGPVTKPTVARTHRARRNQRLSEQGPTLPPLRCQGRGCSSCGNRERDAPTAQLAANLEPLGPWGQVTGRRRVGKYGPAELSRDGCLLLVAAP